jgi:Flp pilus assembly protein CpaB
MTSTVVPQTAARVRRVDLRVLLGLALLLAGVLGTLASIQQAGQRTPVLVMARSVQAGQVIGADDIRVAELGTAPGVATLGAGERARVVGRRAAVPLEQGQVLGPAVVADGPALGPGQVAMSLALAPEHAAAGQVRAGDRVAVVASGKPDEPSGDAGSGVLLSPVSVLSVLPQGNDSGGEDKLLVSLAVRPSQAALLAKAAQGTVDLVLLPASGSR